MKSRALVLASAIVLGGCSPASGPVRGSGGRPGTGGAPAGGGGAASGGQSGTGGDSVGTGGVSSAGTSGGTGGGVASGGATGTGGDGSGGTSGGGGTGGPGTGGSGAQNQDGGAGNGMGGRGGATGGGGGGGTPPDGGADSGASDGPRLFTPCPPAGTSCKIMPLGDSITDGSAFPGGYRPELFRLALMNSKRITFAGRKVNGPTNVTVGGTTTRFPRNHEGYSGYTIESAAGRVGINTLVEQALAAAQPHIVLLMIGTNDVNNDVADLPPRIGRLLDQITSLAPDALLVVAKIVPTRTDAKNMRVQSYNDAIPALVQARVAAGKHIVLVDMYAAITAVPNYKTAVLVDELHPNEEGYAVMARTWYAGIATYLP